MIPIGTEGVVLGTVQGAYHNQQQQGTGGEEEGIAKRVEVRSKYYLCTIGYNVNVFSVKSLQMRPLGVHTHAHRGMNL